MPENVTDATTWIALGKVDCRTVAGHRTEPATEGSHERGFRAYDDK